MHSRRAVAPANAACVTRRRPQWRGCYLLCSILAQPAPYRALVLTFLYFCSTNLPAPAVSSSPRRYCHPRTPRATPEPFLVVARATHLPQGMAGSAAHPHQSFLDEWRSPPLRLNLSPQFEPDFFTQAAAAAPWNRTTLCTRASARNGASFPATKVLDLV